MKVLNISILGAGLSAASLSFAQEFEEIASDPVEMLASSCFAEEKTVWSCQDGGRILSVCSGGLEGKRTVQYRMLDTDGTLRVFPDKTPFLANSDNVVFGSGGDGAVLTLVEGEAEYVFTSVTAEGRAQIASSHAGSIVESVSCALVVDGVRPFQEDVLRKTYTPVKMVNVDTRPQPDGFKTLVSTLKSLEAAGHFTLGAPQEPMDDLGGLTPKAFALSLQDPEFECRADHGGMCVAEEDVSHLNAFLKAFSGPEGTIAPDDLTKGERPDLSKISFSFASLPDAGTPVVFDMESDTAFCEARAYPEDWDAYANSVQAYQELFKFSTGAEYEALWNGLRAVTARYLVHSSPSSDSEPVGVLEGEMAHFPSIDVILTAEGHDWREVILPDGRIGYVAIKAADLLRIDDGRKVCARMDDMGFRLTSYSFGGD